MFLHRTYAKDRCTVTFSISKEISQIIKTENNRLDAKASGYVWRERASARWSESGSSAVNCVDCDRSLLHGFEISRFFLRSYSEG